MRLVIEKLVPYNSNHKKLVENNLLHFKVDVYKKYYPNVLDWYEKKLLKGFENGSRIVRVIRDHDNLYGMSILRIDETKKKNKLCTFFILPEARKNGLGKQLLKASLKDFKDYSPNKPVVVTIPEERTKETFNGKNIIEFFRDFNFHLTSIQSNRYRLRKDEYICSRLNDFRMIDIPKSSILNYLSLPNPQRLNSVRM